MQTSQTHHLSHSSGMEVARIFLHLMLVLLIMLPLIGSDPHSCLEQELLLPNVPCPGIEAVYQMADNWWEKEAFSNQPTIFPVRALSEISCRAKR